MWDNNAPLQLLKTMPNRLNQENLEKIQLLIDADKYKNSIISGFDLCGIFAPFCRGCDRTSIYPCAVSYIRMLQSEGMDIEIDASPSFYTMSKPYKPSIDVPQTKPQPQPQPRANVSTYEQRNTEQRSVRKPVERKYSEHKPRVPKEVKTEIAITETEPTVQQPVQQIFIEEKPVERKVEAKPENPVVNQSVVSTPYESFAPKKHERVERFEEKPVNDKKLRIAVARRKLNF